MEWPWQQRCLQSYWFCNARASGVLTTHLQRGYSLLMFVREAYRWIIYRVLSLIDWELVDDTPQDIENNYYCPVCTRVSDLSDSVCSVRGDKRRLTSQRHKSGQTTKYLQYLRACRRGRISWWIRGGRWVGPMVLLCGSLSNLDWSCAVIHENAALIHMWCINVLAEMNQLHLKLSCQAVYWWNEWTCANKADKAWTWSGWRVTMTNVPNMCDERVGHEWVTIVRNASAMTKHISFALLHIPRHATRLSILPVPVYDAMARPKQKEKGQKSLDAFVKKKKSKKE